jgi:signal transduction histidine kinase
MLGERGLRIQVGALLGVIVLAFVGLNLVVLVAVGPQVRRVEHIYENLGASLDLIAQMRGAVADIRAVAAVAALRQRVSGGPPPTEAMAAHLGDVARLGAEYQPLIFDPREGETWARIRDRELPGLVTAAAALVEESLRGGSVPPSLVQEVIADASRLDALFQDLSRFNAAEVQRSAAGIRRSLTRLLAICGVLLVAGGVGASLLLARAMALIRAYATATGERLAELDAFASRVAHDLRTPLQTLSFALSTIAKDPGLGAPSLRVADRGQGAVRRLNLMISDLLEFARSGAAPEPGAEADAATTLEDVRAALEPAAERAGVRLSFRSDPDVAVKASRGALRSILANLVENGVKYMRDDEPREVHVVARAAGRLARFEVKDTGIGIAPERLSAIFDPFVSGKERRDSYGLGLATVKRLVYGHGGTISVASEVGKGTTFTVTLPRALHLEA